MPWKISFVVCTILTNSRDTVSILNSNGVKTPELYPSWASYPSVLGGHRFLLESPKLAILCSIWDDRVHVWHKLVFLNWRNYSDPVQNGNMHYTILQITEAELRFITKRCLMWYQGHFMPLCSSGILIWICIFLPPVSFPATPSIRSLCMTW